MRLISYSREKRFLYQGEGQEKIDLHCHILPSVDDGAQTVTDSLAMAQKAVGEGSIQFAQHHILKMENM